MLQRLGKTRCPSTAGSSNLSSVYSDQSLLYFVISVQYVLEVWKLC